MDPKALFADNICVNVKIQRCINGDINVDTENESGTAFAFAPLLVQC